MKHHSYKDVIKSTVVVIVAALLQLRVHAVTYYTPTQQGAKTFGKDQFDIDYVLGRIEITNQTPQNWTDFTIVNVGWNQNQDRHDQLTFNNTSRSNNIYIVNLTQERSSNEAQPSVKALVAINGLAVLLPMFRGSFWRCSSNAASDCARVGRRMG